MADTIMPVDTSFTVVDDKISSLKKGLLLVKDCFGFITYHVVLREPKSEINVSHMRSGMYQLELIVGQTATCQSIYIK
jgi:hypothetical protein